MTPKLHSSIWKRVQKLKSGELTAFRHFRLPLHQVKIRRMPQASLMKMAMANSVIQSSSQAHMKSA